MLSVAVSDYQEKQRWGKEQLIKILLVKSKELGRTPKMSDFSRGSPSIPTFFNVFGSWNNALQAAGLPVNRVTLRLHRGITQEKCVNALRRLSKELGNVRPTSADLCSSLGIATGCPGAKTVIDLFGSIEEAVRRAGLDHLPTKNEFLKKQEATEYQQQVEKFLDGKPFVVVFEIPSWVKMSGNDYFLTYAQEKGIKIVQPPKTRWVKIVLDWLRGIEAEGILPPEKDIEKAMGERAITFLRKLTEGLNMAEIAAEVGLTRERVRQILNSGAKKAVRKICNNLSIGTSQACKFNTQGVSLITILRASQKKTIKELAQQAGLSISTISNAENGFAVKYTSALRIAEALETKVTELFVNADTTLSQIAQGNSSVTEKGA